MNAPDALTNISSGHISAWFLDEESGTNANDAVNGNDLAEANGSGIPRGASLKNLVAGRTFGGNAQNQGFFITNANQFNLGASHLNTRDGLTLLTWVNHNAFGDNDRSIVVKGDLSTSDEYDLHWDTGLNKWQFKLTTTSGTHQSVTSDLFETVRGPVNSGVWHMVCAWWDRTAKTINIEVDGSGINTTSMPQFDGNLFSGTKDFKIGSYRPADGSGIFDGTIAYVGFWDRPLTTNERLAIYNDGSGLQIPLTSWPFPNPNTPGSSSGLASLTDTTNFKNFWTFDQASGTIRSDIVSNHNLAPFPYKWEFKGDKASLNTGLSGYWPMDDTRLFERQDLVGPNHLSPTDADSFKNVCVPGSLSGADVDTTRTAYYERQSPTSSLQVGLNDFTIACWVNMNTVVATNTQGFMNKWDSAGNRREWTLNRVSTGNSYPARRGRPSLFVTDDGAVSRKFVGASGQDLGGSEGSSPHMQPDVPYFVVGRFDVSAGTINIVWASGSDAGGTWASRFENTSDPDSNLQNGIAVTTAPFFVGKLDTGHTPDGSVAAAGFWMRYLSDSELETLYGSGLGQKLEPKDDKSTGLNPDLVADPTGPDGDTTTFKVATAAASFDVNSGAGGGSTDFGCFKVEDGQGGEAFNFSSSFTITGWVRLNATTSQTIFAKTAAVNGNRSYILRHNNASNNLEWSLSNSTGTSYTTLTVDATTIATNTWYFFVVGWDSVNSETFGSLNAGTISTATRGIINQSNAAFTIGQGNFTGTTLEPLNGRVDAMGVWSKRLNQGEIDALYNSGDGREIASSELNSKFNPAFLGYNPPGSSFGGFLVGKARNDQRNNNFFGGWMTADGSATSGAFGGIVFAQPLTSAPTAFFGGATSGSYAKDATFGGYTFGGPSGATFIEQHSRTLVKARSEDVVDQGLNLDAQLILLQRSTADFNARMAAFSRANAEFNARFNVEAVKLLPSSVICVSSATDVNGTTQVEVIASGFASEPDTFFVNAKIDFGEPYDFVNDAGGFSNPTYRNSISGFSLADLGTSSPATISGVHDFDYPGYYTLVASFTDNLGQVTSSAFGIDLISSGSLATVSGTPVKGVDYPALDISGLPRFGLVPPNLAVDFDMRASGQGHTPSVAAAANQLNAATPLSNAHLFWHFDNGIVSSMKQPFSSYVNPGLYIPVARYQYIHPSGRLISTSGSGPLGLDPTYGGKPVWISDSLLIGFNR